MKQLQNPCNVNGGNNNSNNGNGHKGKKNKNLGNKPWLDKRNKLRKPMFGK